MCLVLCVFWWEGRSAILLRVLSMVSGKSEYNIFYLYCTGSPRKWHGKTLPVTGEANQSESQQRLTHHSQALDAGEGNKERV